MKKQSLIILSVFAILALIIWFSCNPMNQQNRQSVSIEEIDSADMIRATGDTAIGFSGNVTGGEGGQTVRVTTTAEFDEACNMEAPVIIEVAGVIDTHNPSVRSNKTIIGVVSGACLASGISIVDSASNVIVRNLIIKNPSSDDGVSIFGKNIWIDHCTFVDCADGSIDITSGADYITISWCKFTYTVNSGHNFVNLISSSDGDSGEYRVTFHHNWWSTGCVERMPSVRWGNVHVFNNYYNCPGNNYCIRTRINAEILVENNYFENVQNPWEQYITSGTPGKLKASGNILINTTNITTSDRLIPSGTDSVFSPSYSYTLDSGSNVKSIVMAGAGAP